MSALVQYDSSSDDEGPPAKPVQSTVHEERLEQQEAVTLQPEHAAKSHLENGVHALAQGPIMGPAASMDNMSSYNGYDDSIDDQPAMSERDTIRYLTQATHPMTAMPPSPPGSPNAATSAKFRRFLELKAKGVHFNEDLAKKDAFKNPSLLSTMMDRAGIHGMSQYSTSLPSEVLDLTSFPVSAFKDELLKSQQTIRTRDEEEKKSQSAAGKRTIDFAAASTSEASSRTSTPGLYSKRKRP